MLGVVYDLRISIIIGLSLIIEGVTMRGPKSVRVSQERSDVKYDEKAGGKKEIDDSKCRFGEQWKNLLGGCYIITKDHFSWNEGERACQAIDKQADLGALWAPRDMAFVTRLASISGTRDVFLNGKYSPEAGDFLWQYNRPFVNEETPWGPGEPKVPTTGERVLLLIADPGGRGFIGTDEPTAKRSVLCKRPAIGFRRRSPQELGKFEAGNSNAQLPYGWKLAQTDKPGGAAGQKGGLTLYVDRVTEPLTAVTRTLPPPISKDRKFLEFPSRFVPVKPLTDKKGWAVGRRSEISAIAPVDVIDLVKAREDKLNEMYGRSALRLKAAMKMYPEDYRYPTTDYQRMAHVLTTEIIAQDQRDRKTNAPYEVAKVITMNLFRKGRSIQCYFGDQLEIPDNRQVECIVSSGVSDACVKEILLTGKIVRGCALPGDNHGQPEQHTGCLKTTSGEICFCRENLCNGAVSFHRSNRGLGVNPILGLFSAFLSLVSTSFCFVHW